jgi:poly(beta-D-mannuronate) lyase
VTCFRLSLMPARNRALSAKFPAPSTKIDCLLATSNVLAKMPALMRNHLGCCAIAICLLAAATAAHAQKLRSPWDAIAIVQNDAPYSCPARPPFSKTLQLDSYYIDKHASVIDPQKLAAFQKASDDATHLGQFAGTAADAYLSRGSRAAATCVYSLLQAAATADAWIGKMPSFQGVYMQNWELSGVAMSYLKVRQSHTGTPEQDAAIQQWFRQLAARVREYFDVQVTRPGSDGWNNHLYWAGLAVAAEGIAANDADGFHWGIVAYRMGLDAIQPDGSLIAEMNRGQMALHYHLYSVGPLIMMAELGEANGLALYKEDDGALHRLVKLCVAGLEDPTLFEKRTGIAQVVPTPIAGLDVGWGVPYVRRFPNPQLSSLIAKAAWTRFWQRGGAPPD